MDNLIKKQFNELESYIPGRPIEQVKEQYGLEKVVKLASNESPLGPMSIALKAIKVNSRELNRYPDLEATLLKEAICEKFSLPKENILIGNGSNELIRIAGQAILSSGDEVIFADPSFALYRMIADMFQAKSVPVPLKEHGHDLDAMFEAITAKTKIIFICNPNNPTGTFVEWNVLDDFIKQVPDNILVIIDEAYAEFVEGYNDYKERLSYYSEKPVIITRTFSKLYGLAGLRIGYGAASASYVKTDQKIRDPFNVNLLAQAAATASLKDMDEAKKRYELNLENKNYLYKGLEALKLSYVKSQANFVLIDLGQDSTVIFEKLLSKGVIVRTGEIFGEAYQNFIRVSVGTKEDIDFFLKALKDVLTEVDAK
ncbi:MAG: histidinol-phosphate transaminase [Actinobacteria bacterium]|nr:MAG: histidinol-phosphate transaminase [Actinomycetota bacterium]